MSGAEDRFTLLYQRHYQAIELYVRRRAPGHDVRDLVAEVFTIAWRRLDDVPRSPLPWLYGTARKVLANDRRGTHRRTLLASRAAAVAATATDDPAHHADLRLSVAAAFGRLGDDDAEALCLIAWDGLTLRQAAQVVGCSLPAFAMRLSRARARLRAELHQAPGQLTGESA